MVQAGSAEAVADAIEACLHAPIDTLSQMGINGRARIIERHRIADCAEQLGRLFEASSVAERHIASVETTAITQAG